jgi:pimeloyl-ACP methyl ester carboxylesterase
MELHFKKIGTGPALVILHGLLGSGDNWQSLAKKWAENFTVYLVDQRNHGHSEHSPEFNFDLMVSDLEALLEKEEISECFLLGHSLGGKTAMRFAQLNDRLVKKLVVVDIGTKSYPPHHNEIFEALNSVDFSVHNNRNLVDEQLSKHIPQAGVRMFLMKNLYWKEKGLLAWRFNLKALYANYNEVVSSIPEFPCLVETLFIRGENSGYILDKDWDGIQDIFPNSELCSIANAGHWVHAEQPQQLSDCILDFLN